MKVRRRHASNIGKTEYFDHPSYICRMTGYNIETDR